MCISQSYWFDVGRNIVLITGFKKNLYIVDFEINFVKENCSCEDMKSINLFFINMCR